ncbi:MAG: DUF3160 domain-containing protein, partial [Anaerolineae bacterium]
MKHIIWLLRATGMFLLLFLLSSGLTGAHVTSEVTATGEFSRYLPFVTRNGLPTDAGRFADYVPVPVDVIPNAPAYTPDLHAVINPGLLTQLSDAQHWALETNGFVVVPQGFDEIYRIYQRAYWDGIPAFVTTDAMLHTFHILYDYALRLVEKEHFIGDLEALNAAMLAAAEADYASISGSVQEAAWQNLAFFAVATKLLTSDADVPAVVREVVQQELALIDAHAGFTESPIFGYREDYSQYVPRGHYTRNEDFKRYFRTMMWYGRMAFHLYDPDDPEAARRETRGALLIVRALHHAQAGGEPALDVWEHIYEPTGFFVGTADDLTVYDYAAVAQQVYSGLPDPAMLAGDAQLDAFVEAARQLRKPAIVGGWVTDQEDPEEVTQGFRFMGRRFIPDSYIFQQLVYDKVQAYRGAGVPFTMSADPVRGFPRGLDVPSALDSARALEILTLEGDTDYVGYAEQLAKVRREFAMLPEAQWTANLYWNWLHTLRTLLEVKGQGYPYFMQSPAWVDKDLHAWLGSWTELRHDTILYAKQSYASVISVPEPARGYVEPQPWVYAHLAALTAQMRAGLDHRGLLAGEMAAKLDRMQQLLLTLKTMSEKELRGEPLTDDEYMTIQFIGDTLEYLTTFSEEVEGEITSGADDRMALIADVHTDPNTSQVLEEGVGDAFPVYVVVLVEGQQVVSLGGVFSYYEFKWPMSDRLTDEAWQAMEPKPARPAWT